MPTVGAGGAEIYYEVSGEGDPLLLIMGLGADSRGWILQQGVFAEHHRVVAFDNRGVGRSSCPPGPYSTEGMAQDALAVMDAAGVERAHVLGVSLGGAIAQHLALRAPERVRSLILAATWAGPSFWRARVRDMQLAIARSAGREALITARMLFVFSPPLFNNNPEMTALIEKTLLDDSASLEGYLAQLDAAELHDVRARLGKVRIPTLAITGRRDILVPPELTEEIASLIPGAELTILDSAHAIQFEEVERFNAAVLAFFAKH
jgi:3-oxoadipate enol-lactonase